ncbi:radical SAM protein with 4Fe4S-binding SPASM domain [Mucilaginibacter oryzae]|uniref:Radical SAM protein with 4Fe4S-binding SPASM domain n=1 Tax=Mucilaginibacter oryzae TaxID=468058 RepID=A0A316HGL3_9SPHI|nr:radical SAM protein [Mucilaginibacter oryzae]PWK79181.1 radical SAM protein with 4Fe4S-binding SPASM domain [Mucilaginibacter oryzae]
MQLTTQSIWHTFKRFRTLQTHKISALPIVILMPHSACNCRCVMCDIWKDNRNLKQLTEADVTGLLVALRKFGTKQVLMSGGEALLNANFFRLCEILKAEKIKVSLLSTGLSIKKHALNILKWVDDLIVSIDGDEALHDAIRNVPGAFNKLREGVEHIKSIQPQYRITARTVIHRLNFRNWPNIIEAARQMGIDQVSFLPADVSSHAFNRQTAWAEPKQQEILPGEGELVEFQQVVADVLSRLVYFENCFIAESRDKINDIYRYYAAFYRHNAFPFKKCNAPWVSAVIEADGEVRPCFFHERIGNISDNKLDEILNSERAINFRKTLDMANDPVCVKCVCSLNLSPLARLD